MTATRNNASISVVDDDPSVRRALDRLLRSAGFAVETFDSAEEFIESLSSVLPDCLVLDVHLQGMNGFELQSLLAARRIDIPIIFMTAVDFIGGMRDEWRQRVADQSGGLSVLPKPFSDHLLFKKIDEALKRGLKLSVNDHPSKHQSP